MNKFEAQVLIAEKVERARKLLMEAQMIAVQENVDFRFSEHMEVKSEPVVED